ncbi:S1 family peptidase [Photobacterium sanguinicancri]|uniref:Trypsin n=1 Tax=Photobacterium sanguinicancri TaxID=875932 RepID=A0ABX4FUS7_9GAMM|nr:serine protease [Photobacterium sanguinicancri]OZS42531.1 trypsin [Photobacterium sanguinicancri]
MFQKTICLAIGLGIAGVSFPSYAQEFEVAPRIIDGSDTSIAENPWMASLRLSVSNEHPMCGGTIIDSHWVLTAAHCLVHARTDGSVESDFFVLKPYQISITVGETALSNAQIGNYYSVSHVVVHPKYTRLSKIVNSLRPDGSVESDVKALALDSDIALLRVNRAFPPELTPITLANSQIASDFDTSLGKLWDEGNRPENLTVTGWGTTAIDGNSDSAADTLQTAKVAFLPMNVCFERLENGDDAPSLVDSPFNLTKICSLPSKISTPPVDAAEDVPPYGPDVCKGDSGGPATVKDASGKTIQLGIMSGVPGGSPLCGSINRPAFYTRIGTYFGWVQGYLVNGPPSNTVTVPDFIKDNPNNPDGDKKCNPNAEGVSPNNCNFIDHGAGGSVPWYIGLLLGMFALVRRGKR